MTSESWVERRIREAEERGEFDNLPGAGKPIEDLDKPLDENWWVKSWMKREQLSFALPPTLALRKEVEDLPQTLESLWREQDVRDVLTDLNTRILEARRRPSSGPPVFVKTVDVDQAIKDWRTSRDTTHARSPRPSTRQQEAVAESSKQARRGPRWWRRARRGRSDPS